MKTTVNEFLTFDKYSELELPFYLSKVSAGFPSPCDDFIDSKINLATMLVKNPMATYFVRVSGNSMIGAGIYSGDILVVDRSLEAKEGKIVIAEIDGELTVKRLERIQNKLFLVAENPDYLPIEVNPESEFQLWGVVTYVIHKPN